MHERSYTDEVGAAPLPERGDARREDPRRAAATLLGMLVVAGAILAAPFLVAGAALDHAQQPSTAALASIEHAGCAHLRSQLESNQFAARDNSVDFSGEGAEIARRIVERGERLQCRPAIRSPYESAP